MVEVIAFVSGCVFSLLLAGGCLLLAWKAVEYREETALRRQARRERLAATKDPGGGVVRPKTQRQLDDELDEELQAFKGLVE